MPDSLTQLLCQLDRNGITGYQKYRTVKRYLDHKARTRNTPLSGTFELTPLCNLDCKMCYVHLNHAQLQGAQLLNADQWKTIISQAVQSGMMYARLTGGESLTHPAFREIYLHLRSLGVQTGILSNGILINEDMVSFLKTHRPAQIQITLYGASEDAYERVTGHRVFHTVLENIRRIKAAEIPLSVVTTPNEYMTDGIELVELLHSLDTPIAINSGLMQPREETGRTLHDASLDSYISMLKHHRQLSEKLEEAEPEDLPDCGGTGEAAFGVRCGAGRSSFAVDWRGGMKPCNNFPCEAENIFDLGFAVAWQRINQIATNYPRPCECEGCRYYSVCKHCVAEHAATAPCGHASPSICLWGKRVVAEGLAKF